MSKKINFITMGCAKNEVDTARMKAAVLAAGFSVVARVEDADVCVVNTCSFIEAATKESLDVIFDVAGLPACEQGRLKLVVAGCMPARYESDLEDELSEACAFVTCDEEENIASVIAGLFDGEESGEDVCACAEESGEDACACAGEGASEACDCAEDACASEDAHVSKDAIAEAEEECDCEACGDDDIKPYYPATAGPASAYVKISDGCDRFCSYCTIPYIRGRYHSFTYNEIYANVSVAQDSEIREIVLIAQDTGRWGQDFEEPLTLSWLLDNLAREFPSMLFRVMYLQPEQITDELLDVMSARENIINYLDIPLQHVNARILHDMNRTGSREEFEKLVARIKAKIPDITLRTTLIAGFPGETDEDFDQLCDFCEAGLFDYVGVFAYSREEGTRAFDLPHQIDNAEKQERAQRLSDIANTVCTSKIKEKVGSRVRVLVQGVNDEGNIYGRALCQAPDVDGITYIDSDSVGSIVDAKIVDSLFFDMEAEEI